MSEVSSDSKTPDYGLNWESILTGKTYPFNFSQLLDYVFLYMEDNPTNNCVLDWDINHHIDISGGSISEKVETLTNLYGLINDYVEYYITQRLNEKEKLTDSDKSLKALYGTFLESLEYINQSISNLVNYLNELGLDSMGDYEFKLESELFELFK